MRPGTDRLWSILLFLFSVVILLPGSNTLAVLRQGDEVMHIAAVRESLASDSWMIPRLTDQPNAYKPPLLFWMGMAGEILAGRSLLADRLPVVLLGAGTATLIFLLLRELRNSASVSMAGAALYLFTVGTFKFSRLLMMDQPMAFFLMLVAFLLVVYWKRPRAIWLLAAGFVTGAAFLYKGPLFHFYVLLLFLTFAAARVWRPVILERNGRLRAILRRITAESLALFGASIILPVSWILWLLANGRSDVISFFFIVENIGKFQAENQSVLAIAMGWILYTVPWTALLVSAIASTLRNASHGKKTPLTRSAFVGRLLLGAAASITLLHLLPDRKDAYYVIPAMPLLFSGIAAVAGHDLLDGRSRSAVPLLVQNSLLSLALAVSLVLAAPEAAHPWIPFAALALIPPAAFLAGRRLRPADTRWGFTLALSHGLFLLLAFQWIALPALFRPQFPDSAMRSLHGSRACLISDNWWDVFEMQLTLPDTAISHGAPGSPSSECADGKQAVVLFQHRIDLPGYRQVARWTHWKTGPLQSTTAAALPGSLEAESYLLLPDEHAAAAGAMR